MEAARSPAHDKRTILIGYDGSAHADHAIDEAARRFPGADAVVMTAWTSVRDVARAGRAALPDAVIERARSKMYAVAKAAAKATAQGGRTAQPVLMVHADSAGNPHRAERRDAPPPGAFRCLLVLHCRMRRALGRKHTDGTLDHVAERVGDERIGPLLVERELDPAALGGGEVDGLGVLTSIGSVGRRGIRFRHGFGRAVMPSLRQ